MHNYNHDTIAITGNHSITYVINSVITVQLQMFTFQTRHVPATGRCALVSRNWSCPRRVYVYVYVYVCVCVSAPEAINN